jgi:hypothetical protein
MGSFFDNIQPAVRNETKKVAIGTAVAVIIMWIAFFILHMVMPENVPFDYTVILGGIGGYAIAVLNFFLMGLTVQKVASTSDEDAARSRMKTSYSQRMMLQTLWMILAIVVPFFNPVAGIAPILFPGFVIKAMGIRK